MHGKVAWIGHWIPCCIRGCKCDSRDVCSCARLNTTQAILIDGVLIPSVIIFGCGAYIEFRNTIDTSVSVQDSMNRCCISRLWVESNPSRRKKIIVYDIPSLYRWGFHSWIGQIYALPRWVLLLRLCWSSSQEDRHLSQLSGWSHSGNHLESVPNQGLRKVLLSNALVNDTYLSFSRCMAWGGLL